jgi:hypothetical protein
MNYPDARYHGTPVGEQLLEHYARRDSVRHATPLVPLRWTDLGAFARALFGRKTVGHRHC